MNSSGSSRAPPPPPLNLASFPPPTSPNQGKNKTVDSEVVSLPSSSQRSASYSSSASTFSGQSTLRKSSTGIIKSSPTVNVHTTCGRHTDQFIFGGPSLKDLARSIKRKF
ncbi:hypothetical protein NOR_08411 [Metarhizium rileyi]|uniref:Uncharacterized protein n=1 Tax=Metarhizium rileyi (strain RCEF 4871) TaxID=1649241 RepID=A0A166RWI6_METRR|nr:hypothetical protein NOR_08411 [Metarhizium rileyi RCEF 4871]TWU73609.1 hypothetical protein ED733_001167 [Metarhizium rileyi]